MLRNPITTLTLALLISSAVVVASASRAAAPEQAAPNQPAPEVLQQSAPAIRVVAAARRELVETLPITGTIVAREEAAAGTDLNGMIVTALNADMGDVVRKGDILAVLDRSMLDTQLNQMQATRQQGEATVDQMNAQISDVRVSVKQAEEALARAKALQAKGVATKAELDNAENAVSSAQAKLVSAEKAMAATRAQLAVIDAQIENVRVQIEKTQVRAPADGLVLARAATIGGVVSPSSGPLFRIAIDSQFELEANVAETSLARLSTGMSTSVTLAGHKQPIPGAIRRIAPEIDQKSRLGPIRVSLPADAPVRTGSFAHGAVELVRREGVAVPSSALIFRGEDAFLQVVVEGKVRTAPVVLGARADGYVEIVKGVAEGDEVVARAGTFVSDGDTVTPVRGEATGAIAP